MKKNNPKEKLETKNVGLNEIDIEKDNIDVLESIDSLINGIESKKTVDNSDDENNLNFEIKSEEENFKEDVDEEIETDSKSKLDYEKELKMKNQANMVVNWIIEKRELIFPILFFMISIISLLYYIIKLSPQFFHADCADTILWGEAAYNTRSLLSKDFFYACKLPFGGQLLMLPFIGMFGVSMKAHLIGMCLFALLFVFSLALLLKSMKWDFKWISIMVFSTVFILMTSEKIREIFWGHVIYYSLGILFIFIGLALVFYALNKYEKDKNNKILIFSSIIIFLWFFLCAMNKTESITIFSLPVICGLIGERLFDFKNDMKFKNNKALYIIILVTLLGTALGYIYASITWKDIHEGYASAYAVFSDPKYWKDNASTFLNHWFTLIGIFVVDGKPIADAEGAKIIFKILVAFILMLSPIILTFFYGKLDRYVRVLVLTHWAMTALIAIGFVFGRLSSANWRLSPILVTSVFLTICLARHLFMDKKYSRVNIVIVFPVILFSILSFVDMITIKESKSVPQNIASFLIDKKLEYGYATFWRSHSITVLSDSKSKVREMFIDENGNIRKRMYQTQESWYNDQPGVDEYFLLLLASEFDYLKEKNPKLVEEAKETINFNGYYIVVFNKNIILPNKENPSF